MAKNIQSRIGEIISREKKNNPDTPGVILLIKRIIKVAKYKVRAKAIEATKDGTFSSQDEIYMCSLFPKKVLDILIKEINPRTVLDVGCGTGLSLDYFIENGIDATGIENSKLAIKMAKNKDRILKHNLNKSVNLNKKFDLVWCFEVIEHIHPDFEKNILNTLTSHGNLIVMSAAKPGQGGHGHFNEQHEEYWVEKFKKLNYEFDEDFALRLRATKEGLSENIMVFRAV